MRASPCLTPRPRWILALVLLLPVLLAPQTADAQRPGIEGRPAPAWPGLQWLQVPEGRDALDVTDFRGRVLYLFGFQSWCPGCHSHGFPTLVEVREHFRDDPAVAFVMVQTVFEGFASNSAPRALDEVASYGLDDLPLAHDAGPEDSGSRLMRLYRSGGTPWTVIIGPDGVVRFNGFGIEAEQAIGLIEALKLSR